MAGFDADTHEIADPTQSDDASDAVDPSVVNGRKGSAYDRSGPRWRVAGFRGGSRRKPVGNSSEQLFLSVFLNLMAFFAVLVAISEFDSGRASSAISSINQVFGNGRILSDQGIADPDSHSGVQQGGALERLQGYVKRLADLRRADVRISADQIRIEFEPKELFAEPTAALKTDRNVLMVRLAALLSGRSTPWRVSVFAGVPEANDRVVDGEEELHVARRLDTLVDGLLNQGISTDRIGLSLVRANSYRFGFELSPIDELSSGTGN